MFESLKEQQESINETIGDVSDITSATTPDFSDVKEWKKKSVKKIQEVDEDLDEFTSKGNEVDVGEIMHQIEAVMSKATTSKGKARFAEFKGASSNSELSKLMEYNEEKQNEDGTISKTDEIDKNSSMHEFKNAKEAEITDLDNGGKDILNRAFKRLEKGEISKEDYLNIRNGMKEFDQAIKAGDHVDVSTKFIDGLEKLNTVSDVTGEVVRHGSPLTGVFATYGLTKKGLKLKDMKLKERKW